MNGPSQITTAFYHILALIFLSYGILNKKINQLSVLFGFNSTSFSFNNWGLYHFDRDFHTHSNSTHLFHRMKYSVGKLRIFISQLRASQLWFFILDAYPLLL